MCISRADYVQARVYERLTSHGVPSERAMGVARKVRAHYVEKARQEREAAKAGAASIVEARSNTTDAEES